MNPTQTQPSFKGLLDINPENLIERTDEIEPTGETHIQHSGPDALKARNQELSSHWAEFYNAKTETIVNEKSESRIEIEQTQVEVTNYEPKPNFGKGLLNAETKAEPVIESQKGSGSLIEETGIIPDLKDKAKGIFKSLLGGLSLFGEIFLDTVTMVTGKKEKKAKKLETDAEKIKKEQEKQKKKNNIRAFYDALKSQAINLPSAEVEVMQIQEKANINKTGKIGQESYRGVKDSFGRLTVYAQSMFERGQQDQEKQAKKAEKENKLASISKSGPDLNMDKVAEGGFLSSTGGQGAG